MAVPYWRLSSFYFFYFAILGVILPYWSLYLKQIGFNAQQIGELTALMVVTRIVAPNLLGWLADKTGKRLRLIRMTSLLAALVFLGFWWQQSYTWFALVTLGFSFFWNACLPQFEAVTLFHLKNTGQQQYSRIRLWGSIGFVLSVFGIGQVLDRISTLYVPHIILGLMLCNWLSAIITPEAETTAKPLEQRGIMQVLRNKEIWAFFVVYFLLQISHGPYYTFFSVYLQQHGYSTGMTGGLWALGVCAEILLFSTAARFIKFFGLRKLLLLSLLLTVLRWYLVAYYIDNLICLTSAQLLHAASFGVTHVVAIQLLFKYFGEQHQGKGQAFYSSLSYGLGGMCGSLYSGYGWEMLGATQVFVIAAAASALAFVIAAIGVARSERITVTTHDAAI